MHAILDDLVIGRYVLADERYPVGGAARCSPTRQSASAVDELSTEALPPPQPVAHAGHARLVECAAVAQYDRVDLVDAQPVHGLHVRREACQQAVDAVGDRRPPPGPDAGGPDASGSSGGARGPRGPGRG